MRLPLLTAAMIGAALLAAAPARAADMVAPEPPEAYTPPPVAAVPPPVAAVPPPVVVVPPPVVAVPPPVVVKPAPSCWRFGALGWGWYPCIAGPPVFWREHRFGYGYGYGYGRGYGYGYGGRGGWAHAQHWHR